MIRKKIGDILIEKGIITTRQLNKALEVQKNTGNKVCQILIDEGIITEDQFVETISERLNIPKISLKSLVIDPHVITTVPIELARRYTLIPILKLGNTLTVAMADPLNIIAIDEIKYITRCEVKRAVAAQSEINDTIDEYYSVADSMNEVIGSHTGPELSQKETEPPTGDTLENQNNPVVKLVNLIITQAVKMMASDIHIEPDDKQLRIRYRINGVMKEEASPPKNLQAEIISRIKVAADMDVSEKRLPQDGRLLMNINDNNIDMRISTLPTIHGEKIVIRILDKRILNIGLEKLGFSKNMMDTWNKLILKKEGLILLTGPTSSGKTTTLYATLQKINSIEKNIITIEDPVEYSLPLINQVQTNEKAGLTFVSVLRSILRQNPDIIMVGEIRDSETAMMAIRSAMTGHLVFSTLHTNDAPGSIARLVDMGIEDYLVASALKGVLAQRLLRTNCPHCIEAYKPQEIQLRRARLIDSYKQIEFKQSVGCKKCRMTGYSGQTAIYELIDVDDNIAEMIITGKSISNIKDYAFSLGYQPLFQTGLEKVKSGQICLEELLRVISIMERHTARESSLERISMNV